MGDHTAFFYGTLMAAPVLNRVVNGTSRPHPFEAARITIRPAILHGYCRHKVRNADYPGIVPEKDQTVRGTVATGLTDVDIWRLDQFEGDEYTRKKVRVRLLTTVGDAQGQGNVEGEEVEAETYEFTAGLSHLERVEWDFQEFEKEKLHRWADTSVEYADVDGDYKPTAHNGNVDPTNGRGLASDMDNKLKAAV